MLDDVELIATNETLALFGKSDFTDALTELKELYIDTYSAYTLIWNTRSITLQLKIKRDTANRFITRPDDEYMQKILNRDSTNTNELNALSL
jgi:hypothetical protein